MNKYRLLRKFFTISLLLLSIANSAFADVTFTSPATVDENFSYCPEYFRDEWGTRLSMDGESTGGLADIPKLQTQFTTTPSYTNGYLNFTSTGAAPLVDLLQYTVVGSLPIGTRYGELKPVNSTTYQVLSLRMFASANSIAQFRWFHTHDRWAITSFNVFKGWNVYQINLPAAAISNFSGSNVGWLQGNPQGLELYPVNSAGIDVKVDWIMLTAPIASCPSYTINYNATASNNDNLFSVFVDDDTDLTNGYELEALSAATTAGAGSVNIKSDKLFPGSYNVYAIQSGDWATLKLLDPFDMDAAGNDINPNLMSGLSSTGFSGGNFNGVTTNSDPSFYLNIRNDKTIDTAVFNKISVKINYTGIVNDVFQLFFFKTDGTFGVTGTTVNVGDNTLNFDMSGVVGWSGQVKDIRIDPVNSSGVTFALDYVAIRQAGYVASLSAPAISPAPGTLKVNDLSLSITRPDKRGGKDFAQEIIGNSWNMNSSSDIGPVFNALEAYVYPFNLLVDLKGISQIGDFFYARNVPFNGDSNYFSVLGTANIDTARYVNICFRGWNQTESPSTYNSVARILWQDPREGNADSSYKNGDDIIVTRGVTTYCVDMPRQIVLEPALPPGSRNPWTSISEDGQFVNFFRIDMNENEEDLSANYFSVLDFIHVTADLESKSQAAIVINASLADPVELYYTTAPEKTGGTLIGTLAAARNTNVFKWNTSGVPNGTYYIWARINKNGNDLRAVSDGRIRVNNAYIQDVTPPVLECERPNTGYVFDSTIELAGYALDETRLASLEVFVDNVYFTSIEPDQFHLAARDTYPNYAESNNPGFQRILGATSIAYGAHTVKYVATDAAGNETSCSKSVTRQNGQSTAPLTYPSANAARIDIPITPVGSGNNPTPVPTAVPPVVEVPSLSAKISKDSVVFTVTNAASCSAIQIIGGTDAAFAGNTQIYSGAGATSFSVTSAKVPKFAASGGKSKGKVKEDGTVHLKARCVATSAESTSINISLKRIKSSKTSAKEASILKALRSKAKRDTGKKKKKNK